MKALTLWLSSIMLFTSTAFAETRPMVLRGQGDIRYLGFIKVYDAFLYTPQSDDTVDILAKNVSKCLELDYAVSLSPKDIIKSADVILKKQHPPETLRPVRPQIDAINNAYRAVKKGDQYRLCYDANSYETTLSLNGQPLETVASADFGQIYFGIWLGPKHAIDAALRNDLLGGN